MAASEQLVSCLNRHHYAELSASAYSVRRSHRCSIGRQRNMFCYTAHILAMALVVNQPCTTRARLVHSHLRFLK